MGNHYEIVATFNAHHNVCWRGVNGFAVTLQSLLARESRPAAQHVLIVFILALFILVTVSGLVFVHNPRHTALMVVSLALQVPLLSSPIMAYRLAAGCQVFVGFVGGRVTGGFTVGSECVISVMQQLPCGVGVNVCALVLLILLLRATGTRNLEARSVQPDTGTTRYTSP